MDMIVPTLFDAKLSDAGIVSDPLSRIQAEQLFTFFQHHPLFNWNDSNNGCEGRADAVCVLLDEWGIPNCKSWAFGGAYLKNHVGQLKNNWKYHVAPVLAVTEGKETRQYVLDPSTSGSLQPVEDWAAAITQLPHSYYFLRMAHWYIFPGKKIASAKWNTRNRQNRKWMIQSLVGINGLTATGKARLSFNKTLLKNATSAFEKMKRHQPFSAGSQSGPIPYTSRA